MVGQIDAYIHCILGDVVCRASSHARAAHSKDIPQRTIATYRPRRQHPRSPHASASKRSQPTAGANRYSRNRTSPGDRSPRSPRSHSSSSRQTPNSKASERASSEAPKDVELDAPPLLVRGELRVPSLCSNKVHLHMDLHGGADGLATKTCHPLS